MSDSDLQQRVLAAFQVEFKEQMQAIRSMLSVWPSVAGAPIEEAFRMAHSMKGSARVCDMGEVESIAHQLESLLSQLTKGEAKPTSDIKTRIEKQADAAEDAMAHAMAQMIRPSGQTSDTAAPSSQTFQQETTRIEMALLEELLQSAGQSVTEMVRQERLEYELNTLQKEIELLRQMSQHLRDEGEFSFNLRELTRHLSEIRSLQRQGSKAMRFLSGDLQSQIKRICMVPIGSVFEGFPKMMRDLSAETGKPLRFIMTGAELHADRAVLQALKDPVMHALRNTLSHGIENLAVRRAARKSETAEVRLTLKVIGSTLHIEISDDGQGVNVEAVRAQAVQAGLISESDATALSESEVVDMIFHTGFSTARELTKVSGRGVGLSVVKERVSHLQGSADMETQAGRGSTLQIKVPVSVSTHRMLLVKLGGSFYALPLRSIQALHRVSEVREVEGRTLALHEDTAIPLTTASEATLTAPKIMRDTDGKIPMVVLRAEKPIALHVESFQGEVQALIRPLPYPASLSPHFSGGILTEDGTVVLVLNVDYLLERFRGITLREAPVPKSTTPKRPVLLVVDDSFTARTLQKSILETAGYQVHTAVDGKAALSTLHSLHVDVVVSDIQMPHMNGFEFLAAVKKNPAFTEIPVILVTSLSSKEDQERGLSLGAAAYIVKERFDHQELLNIVAQLV